MKSFKLLCFCSFFLFTASALPAHYIDCTQNSVPKSSVFGTAGFGVTNPDLWYSITTNSYPEATLLSQERNKGLNQGGVYLSPTGFTVGEEGSYWVEITVILQNTGTEPLLIPFFLGENETFDAENPQLGGVVTLSPEVITSAHGTGIVKNVTPGTRLSILATNGGYPFPQDVTVVSWGISLVKLP